MVLNNSGVYYIENIISRKKYIGQAIDLDKRKSQHFWMLKNRKHYNRHLQNSYNAYGENNFIFNILIYCEAFELTKYEQFFVGLYTPNILYNIRQECVESNRGIILSDKTKEKMSKFQKGKVQSEETKKRISISKKGKPNGRFGFRHSEKTKKKISESLIGNANGKATWFIKRS